MAIAIITGTSSVISKRKVLSIKENSKFQRVNLALELRISSL